MEIHVGGDGSLLTLADLNQYPSFIGRDWSEDCKLQKHLLDESDKKSIVLWGTGFECDWKVEFRQGITSLRGMRDIEQYINNTTGELYLLNYDSLTMAAQFEDHTLPDEESSEYKVSLPKGILKLRIVQMIDPTKDGFWDEFDKKPGFIVEYEKASDGENRLPNIPWANI